MQNNFHGCGQDIFCIILKSVTSRHCSNDTEEVDILDRCGLPSKRGLKLGSFNTALYEPRCEKTGFLHMRKQRRRSAAQ